MATPETAPQAPHRPRPVRLRDRAGRSLARGRGRVRRGQRRHARLVARPGCPAPAAGRGSPSSATSTRSALIVTHISDEGFLHFIGVGGWDAQILVGQRVEVATRDGTIPGVIGKKPIHLLKDDDRKKVAEIKDLHIDVGAKDGDEARELVRIGDVAVIAGEPVELPNGRLASRSLDNRLGAYVALETARLVAESRRRARRGRGRRPVQEEITFARRQDDRLRAGARRRDRRRRDPRHRRAGHRGQGDRQARAGLGAGHRPRLDHLPRASSSCCTRRPRPRTSRSRSRPPRAPPAPTPTPSTSPARAFPPASCRSRCATCTRPSSWSSSTTSRRAAQLHRRLRPAPRSRTPRFER